MPPAHHPDPPIYRALIASWADRGRTLPGQHDPEWARLVAPTVHTGQFTGQFAGQPTGSYTAQFSATQVPRGGGR
ncbi:hypothetical protein GTY65_12785 [Streptomyces sp. SID8379]|uniref:hypothetical protein n=1 Tax=unclassified Streptomyces TaxID=2593676 RepID=UPI0003999734|nr:MULTISPECIES: hypothetical protein [unclassified Streptomyces]MYW64932.1 hypothetical protein [Streptomyces sp. SID8379]